MSPETVDPGTPEEATADVVVLGGGSAGYSAALRLAELGRSVVLVEQDKLGGTCLHRGCIPTKALLHAGEMADGARAGASFGLRLTFEGIDMAGVNKYKDAVVAKNWRGLQGLVASRGIRIVEGEGRLAGPGVVAVGDQHYAAGAIVIATGSRPIVPPAFAVDGRVILTSEEALELDHVPGSALVVGGGVIGCEFASAWASLGAQVTVVEALAHLLPSEEESSSKLLERAFRRRKITARLNTRVSTVDRTDDGVRVTLEDGSTLESEVLLVAIGRAPNTAGIGLAEQGVALDERGFVAVDASYRTSVDGVYAVGDVIATPQLAHAGFAEGIQVAEHLAGLTPDPIDYAGVPRITYCSPEVASVGLTEVQAVERHGAEAVTSVTYDLAGNGRSAILDTKGAVKLVALRDGPVLGVHIVGDRVGELIAEAQLIYNWQVPAGKVAALIHPHPTQSEAIGEAHLLLAGKPLHVHG
jgi:dihydrolipoamide dehydrogenase